MPGDLYEPAGHGTQVAPVALLPAVPLNSDTMSTYPASQVLHCAAPLPLYEFAPVHSWHVEELVAPKAGE